MKSCLTKSTATSCIRIDGVKLSTRLRITNEPLEFIVNHHETHPLLLNPSPIDIFLVQLSARISKIFSIVDKTCLIFIGSRSYLSYQVPQVTKVSLSTCSFSFPFFFLPFQPLLGIVARYFVFFTHQNHVEENLKSIISLVLLSNHAEETKNRPIDRSIGGYEKDNQSN